LGIGHLRLHVLETRLDLLDERLDHGAQVTTGGRPEAARRAARVLVLRLLARVAECAEPFLPGTGSPVERVLGD
ncbi:MAG: hypothetical protein ACRDK0_06715, partial [Solirubrobacteraceae bacterium]